MKKRILTSALALCMVLSLSVPAMAAEEDVTLPAEEITVQTESETPAPEKLPAEESAVPEETPVEETNGQEVLPENVVPQLVGMSVSGNDAVNVEDDGNFIFTMPGSSLLSDYTVTLTLGEGAALTETTPNAGDLYVADVTDNTATLMFNVTMNGYSLNSEDYALTLTTTDGEVWTGSFSEDFNISLNALAESLANTDIQLPAGALGSGSAEQELVLNQDSENVILILCAADAATTTVNYVVKNETISWTLPQGIALPYPTPALYSTETLVGWYGDAAYSNAMAEDAVVVDNMTVYGKVSSESGTTTNFLTLLQAGENVTITTEAEWEIFVDHASDVDAGQTVTLGLDIDCNNATYTTLTFAGNFNGGNHTISDARFTAAEGHYYNSSESDIECSGMFNSLGAGQIIANLTLENVRAENSGTYAGILAGLVDGSSSNPTIIQNVQVRGGSALGRTASGLLGFARNATIKYCSSTGTLINGLANGAGIVGINNADVIDCYSKCSPTALTFLGGETGGVVSKNLRGGFMEHCWSTTEVCGENDGSSTVSNCLSDVTDSTPDETFTVENGFSPLYWIIDGANTTFRSALLIQYTF